MGRLHGQRQREILGLLSVRTEWTISDLAGYVYDRSDHPPTDAQLVATRRAVPAGLVAKRAVIEGAARK
jgi:hypothetical protein